MTRPKWSESARVKIERAEAHIRQLESEISTFHKTDPYSITAKRYIDAGVAHVTFHVTDEPKLHWGAIAGDVAHNLRSPLDYLWRRLGYGRKSYFPFVDDAEALKRRFTTVKEGGRRQMCMEILTELNAHKAGDINFWRIESINNMDKHELLVPAYTRLATINFAREGAQLSFAGHPPFPVDNLSYSFPEPICPIKDGTTFKVPLHIFDQVVNMEPQAPLEVAFGEGESIKGQPILSVLNGAFDSVKNIVAQLVERGIIDD